MIRRSYAVDTISIISCGFSLAYERDTGCKNFLEDVFENEDRFPGGSWSPASVNWTDIVSSLAPAQSIKLTGIITTELSICQNWPVGP